MDRAAGTQPTLKRDALRIQEAIELLVHHWNEQPELGWLAEHVGLSEFHLQRLFTRWVGISPKRFLQYLTKEAARSRLLAAESLLETALACGLSGTARLHDLFLRYEGLTPGEFKAAAAGLTVHAGQVDTPFGQAVAIWAPRGLNRLEFCDSEQAVERELEQARTDFSDSRWAPLTSEQQQRLANAFLPRPMADQLSLCVTGTPFQLKVWEALLAIPAGRHVSYESLSSAVQAPSREALTRSVSENALGWLIPCHRIIHESGLIGAARWGTGRKLSMQGWEAHRQLDTNEAIRAGLQRPQIDA